MATTSFFNRKKSVLLLEDSVFERLAINQLFERYLDECDLVQTGTLSEAQSVIMGHSFSLYVVDLNLPDGNGLDFICDVKTVQPDAKVILYTGAVEAEWTLAALSVGVDRILQKPLIEAEFSAAIRSVLGVNGQGNTFSGRIRSMSLLDIVQLKCLNRLSCNLTVSSVDNIGLIQIDTGRVVHSSTGAKEGIEAFNTILSWKDGHVQDEELTACATPTIDTDWETLCMDAAQHADEGR